MHPRSPSLGNRLCAATWLLTSVICLSPCSCSDERTRLLGLPQAHPSPLRDDYPDYVAARFALHIGFYNPGWKTASVHCPILFAVCGKDTVAPPGPTLSYAKKAPNATIKHYEQMVTLTSTSAITLTRLPGTTRISFAHICRTETVRLHSKTFTQRFTPALMQRVTSNCDG